MRERVDKKEREIALERERVRKRMRDVYVSQQDLVLRTYSRKVKRAQK